VVSLLQPTFVGAGAGVARLILALGTALGVAAGGGALGVGSYDRGAAFGGAAFSVAAFGLPDLGACAGGSSRQAGVDPVCRRAGCGLCARAGGGLSARAE
jgi:hypothetical protein